MKQQTDDIHRLIERFLDGDTSNAEERQLYDYFAGDVADDLKQYQPMFAWYATGDVTQPPKRQGMGRRRVLAVAASLLLLVGVGLWAWHLHEEQMELARFEGSYIIRNGQKQTDLKAIMPELLQTVTRAEQLQQRIDAQLKGETTELEDIPMI